MGIVGFMQEGARFFFEIFWIARRRWGTIANCMGTKKRNTQFAPDAPSIALQIGLEPMTLWLTVRCSNQLSYWRRREKYMLNPTLGMNWNQLPHCQILFLAIGFVGVPDGLGSQRPFRKAMAKLCSFPESAISLLKFFHHNLKIQNGS